jgi:hypothetical protein
MKRRPLFLLGLLSLVAILALFVHPSSPPAVDERAVSPNPATPAGPTDAFSRPQGDPPGGTGGPVVQATQAPGNRSEESFSPEMARLVRGIEAGQTVRIQVGATERDYLFRPKRVTADGFQISAGPDERYPAAFQVFEGREILGDGSLDQMAKLSVVKDTLSMAYTTEAGEFLIEAGPGGVLESRLLMSYAEGSNFGHFQCAEAGGLAGVSLKPSVETAPPRERVEISLGAEVAAVGEPTKEGAEAEHPYYRLGAEYDASLKDILILMVSSKSRTGTNLSSKAASYFTYAAIAADVYERQLGLRMLLQELVLIPGDSTEDDIEPAVNDPNDGGKDDLAALEAWCDSHRSQSIYHWGHAMGWTLVDGNNGGMVGWAWDDYYGSSSRAFSVNEPAWTWGVMVHEIGHNVGASHTDGGAMNESVSKSNPKEDFFTENSASGGYTAATDIFNYMSGPSRNFVYGPADLRNPLEMPFGVDDAVSTAVDTLVSFNPLVNDLRATPLFGQDNNLSLVEVGQVFPKAAGTATVSDDQIVFNPAAGYTGNVWLSYTLAGDVGNGGKGWLHSADVVITVGGNNSGPGQNPVISVTEDVVKTDFSGAIRINPLLNDEGKGRLSAGYVEAHNFDDGSLAAIDGAFHLVGASVITGNGTIALEQIDVTRNGLTAQGNTGYLVYTPGPNEPQQVVIQYTVEDADGNQSTGSIFLNDTGTVSVTTDFDKLVEWGGRVATVTFTRTGPKTDPEWVDFRLLGTVDIVGPDSDVAVAGFASFDPVLRAGRVTIPAGESSVTLEVAAQADSRVENAETLTVVITELESLLIQGGADTADLAILEGGNFAVPLLIEDVQDNAPDWVNGAGLDATWFAESGTTSSANTGPDGDHTKGDGTGVYLFVESSQSGSPGKRADLIGPVIDLSGLSSVSLEFYYHMYGEAMGDLFVDIFSGGTWHLDIGPTLSGQQQSTSSDPWLSATIDLSAFNTADAQIRFRGITGSSFTSDMAIDDITVGQSTLLDAAPVILGQPEPQTIDVDEPIYLSVVAEAFPTPTYQWQKDGIDIPGATRSVYFIPSAQGSDSADYSCEVTSGSTVTSVSAPVVVVAPPAQPTGLVAVSEGSTVRLDWLANSETDIASYSLYRSDTAGGPYSLIQSGISDNSYNDGDVTPGSTYYYTVIAVDNDGFESTMSEEAEVTFTVNDSAPLVDAGENQSVVIVAGAGGGDPVAGAYYEWDASTDTPGDNAWASETENTYNWTFDEGPQSPAGVTDPRFDTITHAYDFPESSDNSNGSFRNNGHNEPAVFEFVLDVDGADGSIFESGGSGDGLQVDVVGGVLRGTVQESPPARVSYALTPEDLGRFIHVMLLVDSTNDSISLYVDNDLKDSVAWSEVSWAGQDSASLGNAAGTVPTDGSTTPFDGKIARFRYYRNTVFDSADVDTNFLSLFSGGAAMVTLDAEAMDPDGNPLSHAWTKVSGPGTVDFANASAVDTTATIRDAGTYVLRLSSSDGFFTSSDEMTLLVKLDADNDGIDDGWEEGFFGTTAVIDGSVDSDGDGTDDFFEYLYGSDPTDPVSRGFRLDVGSDAPGSPVIFDWETLNGFVLGTDYLIEVSIDLSDWSLLPVEHYTWVPVSSGERTRLELEMTHNYGSQVFIRLVRP